MSDSSQPKPVFLNPSRDNPEIYVGKVNGVPVALERLADGSIGVDEGGISRTYPGKSNKFGDYWIIDIAEKPYLLSMGVSRTKNNPYAKLVPADKVGTNETTPRKGPAQFGKRG